MTETIEQEEPRQLNPRVTAAMRVTAALFALGVAVIGGVGSWQGLHDGIEPYSGPGFARLFPALVDLVILIATLEFVAATRSGGRRQGWRLLAHSFIGLTLALNALSAARKWGSDGVPWHLVAPAVWAVLIEMYGRKFAGEWDQETGRDKLLPVRLWLRHPLDSARHWLRSAQLGDAHRRVAADLGTQRAAVLAIRMTVPLREHRIRRALIAQVRSGALPPAAVLDACGITGTETLQPAEVLQRALTAVLADDDQDQAPASAPALESGSATVTQLRPAPARTGQRRARQQPPRVVASTAVDRAATIEAIRRDMTATGESWRPDYETMREETGMSHSWCEKVVAEARRLGALDDTTDDTATGR